MALLSTEQRGGAVDVWSGSRASRRPLRPGDRRPEFGWVLLADPEGNEFDAEISVGELDVG